MRHCCACICVLAAGLHSIRDMSIQVNGTLPGSGLHTDLVTGDVASDVGWNLKTPLPFSVRILPCLPALSSDIGLYCEEAFVSDGLKGFADDGGNAGAEP